jgi:hypothetical protein
MKNEMKVAVGTVAGMILGMALVLFPGYLLAKYRPEAVPVLLGNPCIKVAVTVECPCKTLCPFPCPGGKSGQVGQLPE